MNIYMTGLVDVSFYFPITENLIVIAIPSRQIDCSLHHLNTSRMYKQKSLAGVI